MNNKVSIFVAVILSVVVTSIFFIVLESNDSDNEITPFESNETKISNSEFSPSSEIKKINSEMELKEIISTSSNNQNFFVEPRMIRTAIFEESMVMDSVQSLPTPSAMTENSKIQGTEYSTTNNQVTGVDEPDFIKNDSKYIYIVSGNTITIIDGYPGESAKVILKTAIDVEYQYIENMFLNNNRLVIFYNDQSKEEIIPEFDFMPRPTYQPITHVMIIDVSDKQNLKILKDYSIDGNFSQARMIGDNVIPAPPVTCNAPDAVVFDAALLEVFNVDVVVIEFPIFIFPKPVVNEPDDIFPTVVKPVIVVILF